MPIVEPPVSPDVRHIVIRGRLRRRANPHLPEEVRTRLIAELMVARRNKGAAIGSGDAAAGETVRQRVDAARWRWESPIPSGGQTAHET